MGANTRVFDVLGVGMDAAVPLQLDQLAVGDMVLVLGSDGGTELAGRQIVRRPAGGLKRT